MWCYRCGKVYVEVGMYCRACQRAINQEEDLRKKGLPIKERK